MECFSSSRCGPTCHAKDARKSGLLAYLDLYLIHWPMAYKGDERNLFPKDAAGEFIDGGVDYLDTYRAMEKLVDSGLTKSIGVSNFNARQIDRIVENGKILFETP